MAKVAKKRMTRGEVHKHLKSVVNVLSDDVVTALNIKKEKEDLEDKIRRLHNEEIQLKDVIEHLQVTRDKMQFELKKKAKDEADLQSKVDQLKEDRAGLESDRMVLKTQIMQMKREKQSTEKALEHTNDMLMQLKHHIEAFDREIRE